MNAVVADTIKAQLEALKHSLPDALLLSGEHGVGLATIAHELAGGDTEVVLKPIMKDGTPSPNGTISIELIRELYEQTRGKTNRRRVIIIDDADRLSPGASNALLKLLEEPPADTHFVLTTHAKDLLLPTVVSRLQTISIPLVSDQQSRMIIDREANTTKRRQLEFIAAKRPAELYRLMSNEEYFDRERAQFSEARVFLAANQYDKLLCVLRHNTQHEALKLCDSLLVIATSLSTTRPDPALVVQIDRILKARERIAMNGNVRLNLLRAMV